MASMARAGTHLMISDVLPGGATSYIQNGTTPQTATLYVSSGSVGTMSVNTSLDIYGNSTIQSGFTPFSVRELDWIGTYTFFGSPFTSTMAKIRANNILVNGGSGAPYSDLTLSASESNGPTIHDLLRISARTLTNGPHNIYIGDGTTTNGVALSFVTSVGTPTITYDLVQLKISTMTHVQGSLIVDSSVTVTGTNGLGIISSGGVYEFNTSSTTTFFHVAVSTTGHVVTGGPTPAVSSCGSTPSGSVVGDDNSGVIAVGGGVTTACTLTFASTWGTTPTCQFSDSSTASVGAITAQSATAITFGFSVSVGGGSINYHCVCSGLSCR